MKSATHDVNNIGFRPNLSDNLPIYGEAKNCMKENVDMYKVTINGPAPKNIT